MELVQCCVGGSTLYPWVHRHGAVTTLTTASSRAGGKIQLQVKTCGFTQYNRCLSNFCHQVAGSSASWTKWFMNYWFTTLVLSTFVLVKFSWEKLFPQQYCWMVVPVETEQTLQILGSQEIERAYFISSLNCFLNEFLGGSANNSCLTSSTSISMRIKKRVTLQKIKRQIFRRFSSSNMLYMLFKV